MYWISSYEHYEHVVLPTDLITYLLTIQWRTGRYCQYCHGITFCWTSKNFGHKFKKKKKDNENKNEKKIKEKKEEKRRKKEEKRRKKGEREAKLSCETTGSTTPNRTKENDVSQLLEMVE